MERTKGKYQAGALAKHGGTYWAVFQRVPSLPIVNGSHYGTRVDCTTECDGLHGHVFTSEAAARARLAILPTHYDGNFPGQQGREIVREVGRVLFHVGGYFYDVVATAAADLRPGMRVNIGTVDGGDYWQTIARIWPHSTGPRYFTWYVSWEGQEATAAPSIISDARSMLDVLVTS